MDSAKAFLKAENRHALKIINIIDGAILEIDPTDENITIEEELKRRRIYKQIRLTNEELYTLGVAHVAKDLPGKIVTGLSGFDDYYLAKLTEHTIENLGRIADDMKPALIWTIQEGRRRHEDFRKIAGRIQAVWDVERPKAMMFARTEGNTVYNLAHYTKYLESGVVNMLQYKAVLDERTSTICKMLHGTIWDIDSPDIVFPPAHPHCRSRIVAYQGGKPPERDYTRLSTGDSITQEEVDKNFGRLETFQGKYWAEPIKIFEAIRA